MREAVLVQKPVRDQFSILTDNIQTLAEIRSKVGQGSIGSIVDREVELQLAALTELRERVLLGTITGEDPQPLSLELERLKLPSTWPPALFA